MPGDRVSSGGRWWGQWGDSISCLSYQDFSDHVFQDLILEGLESMVDEGD